MPTNLRASALAVAGFLAATFSASAASAYCRTAVCGELAGQLCTPPSPDDCGTALFWAQGCFSFSVQEDASVRIDLATAELLMDQAFSAWENVDCGGGSTPSLAVTKFPAVSCDQTEYNQDVGNANVIIFRDESWPYVGQGNTLALTTVTFSLDTGEIFDADLEVNSTPNLALTIGDQEVQYDLLSILTHEAGHMLGLAHSDVDGATMTVEYIPGDVELRDPHPDDIAGICTAFPPGDDLSTCDPEPRHGFGTVCGEDVPADEGCGCHTGRAPQGHGWLALLGMNLAMGAWRRRG